MPFDPAAVAGAVLAVSNTSPVSYSAIDGVANLSLDGAERNEINVTSISDEVEVFIPGRRTSGNMALSLYVDHALASHQMLFDNYDSGTEDLLQFRITNDDTGDTTVVFQGFVKGYSLKYDKDGALMADFTIKLSSDITITP